MKAKLTKKETEKLSKLASLQLTPEEVEKYTKQLEETLVFMGNLNELKTGDIELTNYVTGLSDVFFEDGGENKRGLTKEKVLGNVKNKKKGMFVVRRLI